MNDSSLAAAAMARLTQQERLAILRMIGAAVDPTLALIDRRAAAWKAIDDTCAENGDTQEVLL